jgi:hypothetical protein
MIGRLVSEFHAFDTRYAGTELQAFNFGYSPNYTASSNSYRRDAEIADYGQTYRINLAVRANVPARWYWEEAAYQLRIYT